MKLSILIMLVLCVNRGICDSVYSMRVQPSSPHANVHDLQRIPRASMHSWSGWGWGLAAVLEALQDSAVLEFRRWLILKLPTPHSWSSCR